MSVTGESKMKIEPSAPKFVNADAHRTLEGAREVQNLVLYAPRIVCIGAYAGVMARYLIDVRAHARVTPRVLLYEPHAEMALLLKQNLGSVYVEPDRWHELVQAEEAEKPLPPQPASWNPVHKKKTTVATVVRAAVLPQTYKELIASPSSEAAGREAVENVRGMPLSLSFASCALYSAKETAWLSSTVPDIIPERSRVEQNVPVATIDCVPDCDMLDIDCCGTEAELLRTYLSRYAADGAEPPRRKPSVVVVRCYGAKSAIHCQLTAFKRGYHLVELASCKWLHYGVYDAKFVQAPQVDALAVTAGIHTTATLSHGSFDTLLAAENPDKADAKAAGTPAGETPDKASDKAASKTGDKASDSALANKTGSKQGADKPPAKEAASKAAHSAAST